MEKIKTFIYLPIETNDMLSAMYLKYLMKKEKKSKSDIVSKAIAYYYCKKISDWEKEEKRVDSL